MIKRMNKVTSLLIAAAAVVSLIPATGVSASDKLETKEGTIENAIAFDGGKYLFEGYKTDNDDSAVYFNDGSKDKQLEDLEDAEIQSKYGTKYAVANDGDEYLVDLSNGSVLDGEDTADKADTLKTKLKTTLSKTDRYGKINSAGDITLTQISQNQFGEVWYEYTAVGAEGTYHGYISESGKYIDTDLTANVYAYNGTKMVKIEKFGEENKDNKITVNIANATTIAQDADNIYREVTVNILNGNGTTATDATAAQVTVNFPADLTGLTADSSTFTVLNKTYNYVTTISNAATDFTNLDELKALVATEAANISGYTYNNGVFTANSTGAVEQTTIDSLFGTSNVTATLGTSAGTSTGSTTQATYIQKISKAQGDKEDDAYLPKTVTSYEISNKYDSDDADDAVGVIEGADYVRVINGVVYATTKDSDSVTVTTLKLKKDKVALDSNTDKKLDVYLAEKDVDEDQDIAGSAAVSIDVDGNTWALNKGRIYKFDGTKFEEMYRSDSSLDSLDVYNAQSLIAWEDGEDIYTTVQEGETTTTPPTTQTGWVNTASGWTFYDAAGKQVKGSWVNAGGVWYMMKADGIMATSWYNDNGTWYYLNASGAMQTGWVKDGSTWYYLQSSGAMKTGWLNDNGTWYYLNGSGAMLSNTTVDGYILGASGAWIK